MAESVVLGGVTYTIPDPGENPNWATGLTPYLVAIAANVASNPAFMQYVTVAATPTTAVSGKTYLITTASLAITMNLPTPAQNAWFIFKDVSNNASANNITLHRNGSEQIDGTTADKALARSGGTWIIMCDGTNWWTINPYVHSGTDAGLVNADVATGAAIAYSKLALTASIVNADVSASAAIARSKLASGTINQVVINDGSGVLSSEAALAVVRGGTNSGTTLNSGRFMVSLAGAIVEAANPIVAPTPINMNSQKVTSLAAASTAGDATRYEQVSPLWVYRRPNLRYQSSVWVDVEPGTYTGSANDSTILFPDGTIRTVTSNATLTNCVFSRAAVINGSNVSGIVGASTAVANTWYAMYAVKAQNNSTDWILIATITQPTTTNYASLNSSFGANGWVYLGTVRCGDQTSNTTQVLPFTMAGPWIHYYNANNVNVTLVNGIMLAGSNGTTALSWAYATGTAGQTIPSYCNAAVMSVSMSARSASTLQVMDSGSNFYFCGVSNQNITIVTRFNCTPTQGFRAKSSSASTDAFDICLAGWCDAILAAGVVGAPC